MKLFKSSLARCVFLLAASAAAGCAGPTTPLGALWGLTAAEVQPAAAKRSEVTENTEAGSEPGPVPKIHSYRHQVAETSSIQFYPPHQLLHDKRDIRVTITDASGAIQWPDLKFNYNGMDVTRSVMSQAKIRRFPEGRKIAVTLPSVRLSSVMDHEIEITYRGSSGTRLRALYGRPVCRAFQKQALRGTDRFQPGSSLLETIVRVSQESGMNPAFTAGLIAQESGFDSRQVSYARAIGLTQITPIAETEIASLRSQPVLDKQPDAWPRFPGINAVSAPMLKTMVFSGLVNAENEWRLNPEKSVRGGLMFLRTLAKQWANSVPGARMPAVGDDHELVRTELLLASYHSGYSRVQGAMSRLGSHWLEAPELTEARKYVNQVLSYCDFFTTEPNESNDSFDQVSHSREGGLDENET